MQGVAILDRALVLSVRSSSFPFTPLAGCFSAFPHGTDFAIGLELCLGLEVNTPSSSRALTGTRYSGGSSIRKRFVYEAVTLCSGVFQRASTPVPALKKSSKHHICTHLAMGHSVCPFLLSFELLTVSQLVSFPRLTKIFQFSRSSLPSEQFGDPWFNACMRLPTAFRSLPRPSSTLQPSDPLHGS